MMQTVTKEIVRRYWAVVVVGGILLLAAGVYILAGDKAQIAIADNLDLFQAQYQMLKNTGTFYSHSAQAPFLHGISRDVLPTEFSLQAVLYQLLPSLTAYYAMYFVKVLLGTASFVLLYKELGRYGFLAVNGGAAAVCAEASASGEPGMCGRLTVGAGERELSWNLACLVGFAYGLLDLFPAFSIAFSAVPLLVYLTLRLLRTSTRRQSACWLAAVFFYPWVSYFSYFGFFLLAYLAVAFLVTAIGALLAPRERAERKEKLGRWAVRLLLETVVLGIGYMVWEYRLFHQMLFSSQETIRETMVQTSLSGRELLTWTLQAFRDGVDLHCESVQEIVVLPVCLAFLVILNAGYIRRRQYRRMATDLYNIGFGLLLLNTMLYGLYYYEPFRTFLERLVPPLKGFQFSRVIFLNPFLWYGLFFIALQRLVMFANRRQKRILRKLAFVLPAAAILTIFLYNNEYNDLQHTTKALVKQMLGKEPDNSLSYGEFYSEKLFEKALEEVDYQGEWSVAYGFHPAVLEYNGIATLDGYLGFYAEEYKEAFREVIAPALEMNEGARSYYDEWGARCYLYSADNATIVEAVRRYPHEEDALEINEDALKKLGCRYIFSRIRLTNADEKGLSLRCICTDESSPYTLYVYSI